MKAADLKGTYTAFYLIDHEAEDIWGDLNGFVIIPEGKTIAPDVRSVISMVTEGWAGHSDSHLGDDQYHTYDIEWTPEYLSYSIDG